MIVSEFSNALGSLYNGSNNLSPEEREQKEALKYYRLKTHKCGTILNATSKRNCFEKAKKEYSIQSRMIYEGVSKNIVTRERDAIGSPAAPYTTRPMQISNGRGIGNSIGTIAQPTGGGIPLDSTARPTVISSGLSDESAVESPSYGGGGGNLGSGADTEDEPINIEAKKPLDKKTIAIYGLVGVIVAYFGYKAIKK